MKRRRGGLARDDSPAALMAATIGPRPRRRTSRANASTEVARPRAVGRGARSASSVPTAGDAPAAGSGGVFPSLPAPPRPHLDARRARTYPLGKRASKVAAAAVGRALEPGLSFAEWLARLPDILAAADLTLSDEVMKAVDAVTKEILYPMG